LLVLFHGSNVLFDRPTLEKARNRRDFGVGFYTTTLKSQAENWARNMTVRFGGEPYLYTCEFELSDQLAVKEFQDINVEWLELVKENRMLGGIQHDFDVVIGPVANDNTMRTIAAYVSGLYEAEEAMRRLRYLKMNNQVSIHTQRAMEFLCLKGHEHV